MRRTYNVIAYNNVEYDVDDNLEKYLADKNCDFFFPARNPYCGMQIIYLVISEDQTNYAEDFLKDNGVEYWYCKKEDDE